MKFVIRHFGKTVSRENYLLFQIIEILNSELNSKALKAIKSAAKQPTHMSKDTLFEDFCKLNFFFPRCLFLGGKKI